MCEGAVIANTNRAKISAGLDRLNKLSIRLTAIAKEKNLNVFSGVMEEISQEHEIIVRETSEAYDSFYPTVKKAIAELIKVRDRRSEMIKRLKDIISHLLERLKRMQEGGSLYGIFESISGEDEKVNVFVGNQRYKVHVHPLVDRDSLRRGQEVLLDQGFNVVEPADFRPNGSAVTVKEVLEDGRMVLEIEHGGEVVCEVSDRLTASPKAGDRVRFDARSSFVLELLPPSELKDLWLEEVPDIGFNDIGGLDQQIRRLREAVEWPYLYPDYFKELKALPPKGVLLHGPPGCGKTLLAKAVASSIAKKESERRGEKVRGYFLNIKGPELLNMYVGETERNIRQVFRRAKEKAGEDTPVVIFFDELESMARMRGSGISSDVETTIVPQLLVEMDGVEGMKNVIVIGASNREDLIDPALLRPGRFDEKITIPRPGPAELCDIFTKHFTPDIPVHPQYLLEPTRRVPNRLKTLLPEKWKKLEGVLVPVAKRWGLEIKPSGIGTAEVEEGAKERALQLINRIRTEDSDRGMKMDKYFKNQPKNWEFDEWFLEKDQNKVRLMLIFKAVETMCIETPEEGVGWFSRSGNFVYINTREVQVTYRNGDTEILYFGDLSSGAAIESILRRAKMCVVRRRVEGSKENGLLMDDIFRGIWEEMEAHEGLPNTTHPDDWARIIGKKGQLIQHVQPLRSNILIPARTTEQVTTGQYL